MQMITYKQLIIAMMASLGYLVPIALLVLAWPYVSGWFAVAAVLAALVAFLSYDRFVEKLYAEDSTT